MSCSATTPKPGRCASRSSGCRAWHSSSSSTATRRSELIGTVARRCRRSRSRECSTPPARATRSPRGSSLRSAGARGSRCRAHAGHRRVPRESYAVPALTRGVRRTDDRPRRRTRSATRRAATAGRRARVDDLLAVRAARSRHNTTALDRCVAAVRAGGAVPAITAVLDGVARVGLEPAEHERILSGGVKVAERDLPVAIAAKRSASPRCRPRWHSPPRWVSGYSRPGASAASIASVTARDISADLGALATHPVVTVSAGVKAFLDIPRTLEHLETAGVPVLGWRTDEIPDVLVHHERRPGAASGRGRRGGRPRRARPRGARPAARCAGGGTGARPAAIPATPSTRPSNRRSPSPPPKGRRVLPSRPRARGDRRSDRGRLRPGERGPGRAQLRRRRRDRGRNSARYEERDPSTTAAACGDRVPGIWNLGCGSGTASMRDGESSLKRKRSISDHRSERSAGARARGMR